MSHKTLKSILWTIIEQKCFSYCLLFAKQEDICCIVDWNLFACLLNVRRDHIIWFKRELGTKGHRPYTISKTKLNRIVFHCLFQLCKSRAVLQQQYNCCLWVWLRTFFIDCVQKKCFLNYVLISYFYIIFKNSHINEIGQLSWILNFHRCVTNKKDLYFDSVWAV